MWNTRVAGVKNEIIKLVKLWGSFLQILETDWHSEWMNFNSTEQKKHQTLRSHKPEHDTAITQLHLF